MESDSLEVNKSCYKILHKIFSPSEHFPSAQFSQLLNVLEQDFSLLLLLLQP